MLMKSIEKRLAAIEARQPPPESEWEPIFKQCTDEELERLGGIVERKEAGIDPTAEEQAFIDDLEARYAPD